MHLIIEEENTGIEIPYKNDCRELIIETHEEILILERLLKEANGRLTTLNQKYKVTIPHLNGHSGDTWKNLIVSQIIYYINATAYYMGYKQRF